MAFVVVMVAVLMSPGGSMSLISILGNKFGKQMYQIQKKLKGVFNPSGREAEVPLRPGGGHGEAG